ncbi:MAG: cytochrome c maturation protein CcmE [Proteobacteria bacterium]|nr:MAG: cytochrome c maturation protein CcmE [Pseudomonadota bacterium]
MNESDASPDEPALTAPVRRRHPDEIEAEEGGARRGLMIVIPLVMVAGAVCAVVMLGLRDKGIYAKPLDELVREKDKYAGKPVRAEGTLVHGSLMKRDQPCEYRFEIERGETKVPVRFAQCIVPDTFRDVAGTDVAVTVEGKLLADGHFEASSVLAKCPSKYEMKERQSRGETMPHAAPQM